MKLYLSLIKHCYYLNFLYYFLHIFQTLTRTRGSVGQSVFAAPPGCAIAYEPHLDADSGDSGRGPSEEGNQFLLSDNYRSK